ncbi:MAG TPA: HAMP domain-containing sensor histidine kinase [Isosphaeraceae bacterium]|nr:HAMP domain-containing sensor histidine kinase [Isosphaeraceae bacterium]
MRLASRISAFFLATLGAVLVGFSVALYALASNHLHRLIDERLDSALATLAAVAEFGPGGVEWEPDARALGLGRDNGPDQVRWAVCDGRGRLVDRSPNLDPQRLSPVLPAGLEGGRLTDRRGHPWRAKLRRIKAPVLIASSSERLSALVSQRDDEEKSTPTHDELVLVAYAPLAPTEATLSSLALALAGLSSVLWLFAAVVGSRLCRRALDPLSRMALAARDTSAAEPGARLPVRNSGDELEDLGHAFNGLLGRLHETLERQRRFTSEASHQLRTPLTALLGQVEVALRQERTHKEYERVLGVVRAKAVHLRQIVESLLFLARAEAEAGRPDAEVVDLHQWLTEHLQSWSSHPRAADLHAANGAAGPLHVRVHPPLLCQLVDNLLENACKYSRAGTPVEIRLWQEPGVVAMSVADEGCGLSVEERAQVFQPFYRSPQARRRGQPGVGLGLAIVQRIALAFDGTVRVESEQGAGSRFEVRLPVAEAARDQPPASPS